MSTAELDEDFLGPDPNPYKDLAGTGNYPEGAYRRTKVYTIPSSGSVFLFGPEIEVVDTPEFQRLAGIKQLGLSYLVYRGATHTRFEHSLGTLDMAQRMLDAVMRNPGRKRGVAISAQAVRLTRLAALLHDLPHVPFGHTLEDEFRLMPRHDSNPTRIEALLSGNIEDILRRALGSEEFDELRYLILPSLHPRVDTETRKRKRESQAPLSGDEQLAMLTYPFVADIVGNTVCADLLDYTARDMHNTGLVGALGDRFLQFLTITPDARVALTEDGIPPPAGRQDRNSGRIAVTLNKRGMPRPDVESEILKLLTYRYELAERVYLHHAKNAASAMLARAVENLHLHAVDTNFLWLTDDLLLQLLAQPELLDSIRVGPNQEYLKLPGSEKGSTKRYKLTEIDLASVEEAKEMGAALLRRRLFKIAYLGVHDDLKDQVSDIAEDYNNPDGRRMLEDRLADSCGVDRGRVVVHCPSATMMEKVARARVQSAEGTIQTLDEWDRNHAGRVQALNEAHRQLWRIAVYAHPDLTSEQVDLIAAKMSDILLGVPSRYVRDAKKRTSRWLELVWDSNAVDRGWAESSKRESIEEIAARAIDTDLTLDEAISALNQSALRSDDTRQPGTDQPTLPMSPEEDR